MVTRYDVTRDSLCGLNGASIYDSHHYLDMVLSRMSDLSEFYPGFHNWMAEKVIPGLFDNQRSLHLYFSSVNQQLAGITILKHSQEEQKLCCLRVLPAFRNSVLGIRMFEDSFELLGTEKPLLSIAEESHPQFHRIFNYFGFEHTQSYPDLYRPQKTEHSYNGEL